jgi:membrane protein YqaA with SNARE-associated domain
MTGLAASFPEPVWLSTSLLVLAACTLGALAGWWIARRYRL